MRHVIHNVITFYEMEAQATCAVLGEVQKSLMAEPTWAQRVDKQMEETEAHLQQRLCGYDRILEGLVGAPQMSASV